MVCPSHALIYRVIAKVITKVIAKVIVKVIVKAIVKVAWFRVRVAVDAAMVHFCSQAGVCFVLLFINRGKNALATTPGNGEAMPTHCTLHSAHLLADD